MKNIFPSNYINTEKVPYLKIGNKIKLTVLEDGGTQYCNAALTQPELLL